MKVLSKNGINQTVVQIPAAALPAGTDLSGTKLAKLNGKYVEVKLMAAALRVIEQSEAKGRDKLVADGLLNALATGHPKDADTKIYAVWSHHVSRARGDEDPIAVSRGVKACRV